MKEKKENKSVNLQISQIVETYYTPLYRFGYSLAKNEHEASDLTQQTFLIYAEKGDTLRDRSKIKSWLFTTLYREFLRIRRKGKRMDSYEPQILENTSQAVSVDTVAAFDSKLAVESLQEVSENYRLPLTMFYLQDLSYKEIAAKLNLPIGTVMSRLSRGKAQLKEILLSKSSRERTLTQQ